MWASGWNETFAKPRNSILQKTEIYKNNCLKTNLDERITIFKFNTNLQIKTNLRISNIIKRKVYTQYFTCWQNVYYRHMRL